MKETLPRRREKLLRWHLKKILLHARCFRELYMLYDKKSWWHDYLHPNYILQSTTCGFYLVGYREKESTTKSRREAYDFRIEINSKLLFLKSIRCPLIHTNVFR